jgi:hypothetical protein
MCPAHVYANLASGQYQELISVLHGHGVPRPAHTSTAAQSKANPDEKSSDVSSDTSPARSTT